MTAADAEDERGYDPEYYDDPIVPEGEEDKKMGRQVRPPLSTKGGNKI